MEKEHEIDVVSLFWIVWDQKFLVLALSLLGGAIAAAFALTAIPLFRAQVVVTEVHDTGMGAGGSLMGQLGGLASIAGLNLNANGPDAERAAILESAAWSRPSSNATTSWPSSTARPSARSHVGRGGAVPQDRARHSR